MADKDEKENPKIDPNTEKILDVLASEEGRKTISTVGDVLRSFRPTVISILLEIALVLIILIAIMISACNEWIEDRTTETLFVLVIGGVIGAKFKK